MTLGELKKKLSMFHADDEEVIIASVYTRKNIISDVNEYCDGVDVTPTDEIREAVIQSFMPPNNNGVDKIIELVGDWITDETWNAIEKAKNTT